MNEIFNDLAYAKYATIECAEKDGVLVDMHGLVYWAERVETLRRQIKEQL